MNCKITQQFFSVMRLLQEEQKKPKDYGTGEPLYHAEVGFLGAIHKHPEKNVSELSEILGITKGAITQLCTKLEGKELIEIYKQPGNKKEKYFRLTQSGEVARAGHEAYHAEANHGLCEYFRSLDAGQAETISAFLAQLEKSVPFCEFQCQGGQCG